MTHFRNNDIILTREEVEVLLYAQYYRNKVVREKIIKTAHETEA